MVKMTHGEKSFLVVIAKITGLQVLLTAPKLDSALRTRLDPECISKTLADLHGQMPQLEHSNIGMYVLTLPCAMVD